jgi:hypothetical protein
VGLAGAVKEEAVRRVAADDDLPAHTHVTVDLKRVVTRREARRCGLQGFAPRMFPRVQQARRIPE